MHEDFITITHGMSGFFAVQLTWNTDHEGFWEPLRTGIGRYVDREDAVKEAKYWAKTEDLEFQT